MQCTAHSGRRISNVYSQSDDDGFPGFRREKKTAQTPFYKKKKKKCLHAPITIYEYTAADRCRCGTFCVRFDFFKTTTYLIAFCVFGLRFYTVGHLSGKYIQMP